MKTFKLNRPASKIDNRFINEPKPARPFFKEDEPADLGDTKEFSDEMGMVATLMEKR